MSYPNHKSTFPNWGEGDSLQLTGYYNDIGRLHTLGLTRKSCECERELVKQDKWKGWNLHRLSHFWPTGAGLRESNMVAILQTTTVQEPDLVSEVFQEWDRVNSHSGKEIIARLGRPGTEGKWPLPCLLIVAMVKKISTSATSSRKVFGLPEESEIVNQKETSYENVKHYLPRPVRGKSSL